MFLNYQNVSHRIRQSTRNGWLFFLDLIFPIECLSCGLEGAWLCSSCFRNISLKGKQYCLHCKQDNNFGEFCPACRRQYSLDGVLIASLYEDRIVNRLIKALKYNFVRAVGNYLGKLLILFIESLRIEKSSRVLDLIKTGDLVIPVPLAKKRLCWRGFNQAEILGKFFADSYGLEMNTKNLVRIKHKKPQAKLNEIKRLENIRDCFAWRGHDLNGRDIILIDDIVTTGATLNECAVILKAGGAGRVYGLVVAKG